MNRKLKQVALATALLVPALSFAQQPNGPVTRTQVREELAQLVKAGYKPAGHDNKYPSDLWAAQARAAAANTGRSLQPDKSAPTIAPNANPE